MMQVHAALLTAALSGTPGERAFPYLTALIIVPAFFAFIVLCIPRNLRIVIRVATMAGSLAVLGVAAAVATEFQAGVGGYQMVSDHAWVAPLGVSWGLGVDGISLFLVLLTAALFPITLAAASERENLKSFSVWMLLLEVGCIGSFISIDLLLFFLFFETTLVPVYFLIAGWGGVRRNAAALKFFIYTFVGSAVMLVGMIALVFIHQGQTGITTFDVRALANTHLTGTEGVLLFGSFTIAFAVKAPVWPFHTWQPAAYGEAPVAGSVILAGIMAKLGTYGVIRFDLTLFPHTVVMLAPVLLTLGAIGVIYGAIVAARQRDLKRLVAFSSLAHIGFIVIGAFALTGESISGAVLQMVNHGVYTAALFLLVGMIYRRRHTNEIARLSGLQQTAPILAGVFTVVMLASIGVPGLNGFVGEFLILLGTFLTHRWWAVVAVTGVILSAVYMLWGYQQVFHGVQKTADGEVPFREMSVREGLVMAPLVILIVLLGVYPKPVLDRITPSVDQLVTHIEQVARPNIPAAGQPRTGVTTAIVKVGK